MRMSLVSNVNALYVENESMQDVLKTGKSSGCPCHMSPPRGWSIIAALQFYFSADVDIRLLPGLDYMHMISCKMT